MGCCNFGFTVPAGSFVCTYIFLEISIIVLSKSEKLNLHILSVFGLIEK